MGNTIGRVRVGTIGSVTISVACEAGCARMQVFTNIGNGICWSLLVDTVSDPQHGLASGLQGRCTLIGAAPGVGLWRLTWRRMT
jgi:hypothetical protein